MKLVLSLATVIYIYLGVVGCCPRAPGLAVNEVYFENVYEITSIEKPISLSSPNYPNGSPTGTDEKYWINGNGQPLWVSAGIYYFGMELAPHGMEVSANLISAKTIGALTVNPVGMDGPPVPPIKTGPPVTDFR